MFTAGPTTKTIIKPETTLNTFSKRLVASVATVIALTAPAFANLDAITDFNVNFAKLDHSLDTDGNNDITVDEIIDGHVAEVDINDDGRIDAYERGLAELYIKLS